jgi:hypothetical protein
MREERFDIMATVEAGTPPLTIEGASRPTPD